MGNQSAKNNNPALFATAESLSEFRLSASEAMPDARTACHAADAWARVTGRRSVFVSVGLDETLDALPALATPFGDEIELTMVCVLGNDRAMQDVHESGRHLARGVYRMPPAAGRKRSEAEKRKKQLREFLDRDSRGVQLVLVPWSLSNSEIKALIESVVHAAASFDPATASVAKDFVAMDFAAFNINPLIRSRRPLIVPGRRFLIENDPGTLAEFAHEFGAAVLLPTVAAGAPPDRIDAWREGWARQNGEQVPLLSGGSVVWNYALLRSDCILTVDARLTEGEMFGLHDFPFVRAKAVHSLPPELLHETDGARNARSRILAANSARVLRRRARWRAKIDRKSKKLRSLIATAAARSEGKQAPFDPAWISHAIFAASPEHTVFAAEGNGAGMWMWSYNHLRPALYPDRMATIGLMLPWVMGAARGAPERPIWCFAGDGSLGYQPDLFRELPERAPNAVVFVFNNRAWSSIRLEQTFLFRGRYPGTALPSRDFAKLARRHGCEGVRVESEADFRAALRRANEPRDVPLVIDIPTPQDSLPFAGLSFALAELDYLLRPMVAPFIASVVRAAAVGALPARIPRMLLRLVMP
ncbi:MAG: thiamine pyrophosphate-dependent enzyme [bacterium]|nr:thiamine pyrophosphate-dependent enzyme [bacterium]